nr:molybdopterin-guanine dinucleotide biosynthesis protein B [Oceanobacillus luteolus]
MGWKKRVREIKVIQVVGYRNSGKTTTVIKMLEYFQEHGIKAASLKHHGHGGVPLGFEDKDNKLHQKAGAMVAGVEGDGVFQLVKSVPWELNELVDIYKIWDIDLLIIEGFKQAGFEKIVMIKDEKDFDLLQELTNIVAVVTEIPLENIELTYPVFRQNEISSLARWVIND